MFTLPSKSLRMVLCCMGMQILAGCASQPLKQKVADSAKAAAGQITQQHTESWGLRHVHSVAELPGGFAEVLAPGSERGDVTVNASGSIRAILQQIAGKSYSVSFENGTDDARITSISVQGLNTRSAIRQAAANAGYVAVFDDEARNVVIADQANWTFRIPVRLLQRLSTDYGVDGSGAAGASLAQSGSSGTSGMPGSGGSSGYPTGTVSSVQTTFNATSSLGKQTATQQRGGIETFLQIVAGQHAVVSVSRDSGYIAVRGDGVALERMHRFLNQYVYDNDRRVDIRVSVLEVSLDDSSSYGIDWSRVLSPLQNSSASLSLNGGAGSIVNPSFSLNFTTASITSVISALRSYARVSVLTQPSVTAMNRSPVAIFDGTSIPYLGSIMTTLAGIGTAQTAASASFAESGVSMSVLPDILSDTEAQITLAPIVSSVSSMQTFNVSGSTLTAPETVEKRVLMQTIVRNGETVILGGIKTGTDNSTQTTLPVVRVPLGNSSDNSAAEVVILLQSTVVPPRRFDTLVAESL